MCNKDKLKIKLLSMLSLSLMIIILFAVCFRLLRAIIGIFIYFTGLITIFIFSILFIMLIIFAMYKIIKNITFFKRGYINYEELLNTIITFEIKTSFTLFFISIILGLIYFLH